MTRTPALSLIVFPPCLGTRNPSPFCLKASVLLHLSALPYRVEHSEDPRVGPYGKLPVLRDGEELIGDSELIRQYLAVTYRIDFDPLLTARQRAAAHAFARMLEERTYWALVDSRWLSDENWPAMRDGLFGDMPFPARKVIPGVLRRRARARIKAHGIGLHTRATIEAFAIDDLKAVADWLGDQPFMMGTEPCSLDATVYAMLASFVQTGFETPMRDVIMNDMRLAGYLARCDARWYEAVNGRTGDEGCDASAMAA